MNKPPRTSYTIRLEAKVDRLVADIYKMNDKNTKMRKAFETEIKTVRAESERLKDLFVRLQTWSQAYPLTAFPKPDLKKAHKALKEAGMTLDAVSADAMRHVLSGITNIVDRALKGKIKDE